MAASYGGQVILPPPQHHLSLAGVHPPHEPPAAFLVVRAQEPDDDGEEEQARHRVPHPCLVDHGHPRRLVLVPPREEQRPDRAGAVPAVAVVVFAAAVVAQGAVPGGVPLHVSEVAPVRAGQDGAGGGRGRDHGRSARRVLSLDRGGRNRGDALIGNRAGGEAHVCAVPRRAGHVAKGTWERRVARFAQGVVRSPWMCGSGPAACGFAGARTGWGWEWGEVFYSTYLARPRPCPGPASRLAFAVVVCTGRFPRGSTRAGCSTLGEGDMIGRAQCASTFFEFPMPGGPNSR
jgi:hypothetical protein